MNRTQLSQQVQTNTKYFESGAALGSANAMRVGMTEAEPPSGHEIPEKVVALFTSTEYLSELIVRIACRLAPVMRSVPASAEAGKSESYQTELGDRLAQLNARMRLMIAALQDVEDRLEV